MIKDIEMIEEKNENIINEDIDKNYLIETKINPSHKLKYDITNEEFNKYITENIIIIIKYIV